MSPFTSFHVCTTLTTFHPEFSLFTLTCINLHSQPRRSPKSPRSSSSPNQSTLSNLAAASEATLISKYSPDEYEKTTYYNGITGNGSHPPLVYRSDFLTTPFPKPGAGRHAPIPVKTLRGVFDTPLNEVWDTVGPQIRDLIKAHKIQWSSIDPARFFTHTPLGEKGKGSLGPVVVWVGVLPGSTSPDTAHDVSQQILTLLRKNGAEDVVVEWREAVPQRLAGPPLMSYAFDSDPTHYVRRFLTALLGVPLAIEDTEDEDSQGTLTLWFHENKDKNGDPSDKVYGVSNCHVLRKHTTVDYVHRVGAAKNHVCVCGMRRFQRGLEEITEAVAHHGIVAYLYARNIIRLQAREEQDLENADDIWQTQRLLDIENDTITRLKELHDTATKEWSDIKLYRDIGHIHYAPAIKVDEGRTRYTTDWAAFLAVEAKVRNAFEGNVVDLGAFLYHSRIHLV